MNLTVCIIAISFYIVACHGIDNQQSPNKTLTQAYQAVTGSVLTAVKVEQSTPHPSTDKNNTSPSPPKATTTRAEDKSKSQPTDRPTSTSSVKTQTAVNPVTNHSVSLASKFTTERAVTTSEPHKVPTADSPPPSTSITKTTHSMSSTVMPASTEEQLQTYICESVSFAEAFVVGMATLLALEILAYFIWIFCCKRKPQRWIPHLTDTYSTLLRTDEQA